MISKYLFTFFLPVLFYTTASLAHQLRCEIYDLATGDILSESGLIRTTSEDLRKDEPYKLTLEHDLMNAEFQLGFLDANSETLLFQIRTREVVNSEFGKFTIAISELKPGKSYILGRVFTEITGLGDNTMSSCNMIIEN